MSASQFTATPFIAERSEATPGLWNNIFSIISKNVDQLNSDLSQLGGLQSVGTSQVVGGFSTNTLRSNSGNTVNLLPFSSSLIARSYDSGGALFNVVAFGADPSGVADSTTAIQSAINAGIPTNGAVIYVPPGTYNVSTLSLYRNMTLRGAGGGRSLGNTTPTLFAQTSSASTTMLLLADINGTGTVVEDIGLFSGRANNFGGVKIAGMEACQLRRVSVSGMTGFTIQVIGGANTNFAAITDCALTMTSNGTVIDVWSNSTLGMDSSPVMTGCFVTTNGMGTAWISINSTGGGIAPDSPMFTNNRFISGSSVSALIATMVNARFVANRFETTGTAGVMVVRLSPPTGNQPCGFFLSNTYPAPSGLTWVDSLLTASPRMFEAETSSAPMGTFGVRTVSGFSAGPSLAFASEASLGFYRSGVSTLALSYGTLNLQQSRTVSMRTLAASAITVSAAGTNTLADECGFVIGGASGASFWINSAGTTWIFNSAASAKNA